MSVQPVQSQDAPALLDLMGQIITTQITPDPDLQADMLKNVSLNLEWALAYPQHCCHLKYSLDQAIVGVILIKEYWNLCSLFVDPAYHRQGIGRALFLAATEACRGKSPKQAIWLNAAPKAIPFYKAMGCVLRDGAQPQPGGIQPMQLPFS